MIDYLVQAELAEHAFPKGFLAYPVARRIGFLERGLEKFVLFWCGVQLELRSQFHIMKFSTFVRRWQGCRLVAFPLPPQGGSLQARLL
jgi:hypothetical protein